MDHTILARRAQKQRVRHLRNTHDLCIKFANTSLMAGVPEESAMS